MGRIHRILVVTTLVLSGWGTAGLSGQAGAAAPPPSSETSMDAAEFEALFHAHADSARMRFTDADVQFIEMMISHHGQALEMSALAANRTTSPEILTLAARIEGGQKEELVRMRQWLAFRGLSEPEVSPASAAPEGAPSADGAAHPTHGVPMPGVPMPGMPMHEMPTHEMADMNAAEHLMPGLLTAAEMEELAGARGVEFDRLYLFYMIYHHRGAVLMVDELFSTEGAAQGEEVFRLASEIRTDQNTEVARMERMLATLAPLVQIH